jgi:hypothetical protein
MRSEHRREQRALLAGWLLAAALPAAAEPSHLVDRILAVIDGRPLLLSEVRLVERLRGLPRERALEQAIDERLMFEQAVRLPQTAPSAEESERAYAGLVERLQAADERVDETALRELARRQATILKYIEFRFRPLARAEGALRPDPGEASEPGESGPELLEARIEEWVAELREEATIRYNPAEPGGE